MKRTIITLAAVLFTASLATAQTVKLPEPEKTGGKDIMETLWSRESGNEYSQTPLSAQDLSNLLFAGIGINRDNGKLTSPTASNKQEIRLFVFTETNVSEYINKENALKEVAKGDYRHLVASRQEWVKGAPLSLVIVADGVKYGNNDARSVTMQIVDAGIVTENICLFCAGKGLVCRPRATMAADEIKELLGLGENQTPVMNIPVGYKK